MSDYISNFCIKAVANKRIRSSSKNHLLVRRSSTKFADCSFSIAGTLNGTVFPTVRRTHHLCTHINSGSKLILSNSRMTARPTVFQEVLTIVPSSSEVQHGKTFTQDDIQAPWSPAWKLTITQDIQAPWESSTVA